MQHIFKLAYTKDAKNKEHQNEHHFSKKQRTVVKIKFEIFLFKFQTQFFKLFSRFLMKS
jgi:hypothetical protein